MLDLVTEIYFGWVRTGVSAGFGAQFNSGWGRTGLNAGFDTPEQSWRPKLWV